ncbi:MAG: hypothetical protein V4723_06985 [Pseudomonadota bacterium]
MYEKKVGGAYLRDMGIGFGVYVILLVASIVVGRGMEPSVLRTLFLCSPIIGLVLVCWAIVRHVQRVDEFIRKETLESIAIAAALTAAITFSYGFLENVGLPRLSMFCVLPLMGAMWGLVACARRLQSHE